MLTGASPRGHHGEGYLEDEDPKAQHPLRLSGDENDFKSEEVDWNSKRPSEQSISKKRGPSESDDSPRTLPRSPKSADASKTADISFPQPKRKREMSPERSSSGDSKTHQDEMPHFLQPSLPGKELRTTGEPENMNVEEYRFTSKGAWSWQTDPLEINPKLVVELMELYFDKVNSQTYCMFPRTPWMRWFLSKENKKSPKDLTVIYSMLTIACRFYPDIDRKVEKELASVARYAIDCQLGKYSLQLVQSRQILGLYYFGTENAHEAWDLCGMAIRGAQAMKMNVDRTLKSEDEGKEEALVYGLDRCAVTECRRRTFWSAYMMDVSDFLNRPCQ
jgi:hypothetical protein